MGQVVLAFLAKHWVKLLPIGLALALALCVRQQVRAGAKAEAFARVAELTAKYSQQQEAERVKMRKESEVKIGQLEDTARAIRAIAVVNQKKGVEKIAQLRLELSGEQRTKLDSAEMWFNTAAGDYQTEAQYLRAIILERTKQRDKAEQLLADSHRYNKQLQEIIKAERPSNTGWKVAAGVATVVAVVVAVTK